MGRDRNHEVEKIQKPIENTVRDNAKICVKGAEHLLQFEHREKIVH